MIYGANVSWRNRIMTWCDETELLVLDPSEGTFSTTKETSD